MLKVKNLSRKKGSTVSLWNPYKKEVNIQNTAVRYFIEEQKEHATNKTFHVLQIVPFFFSCLFSFLYR